MVRSRRGLAAALVERGLRPVPASSLAAFRVAAGLSAAVVAARFVSRGWVERLYLAPSYHFTYPGLSWVRPLPAAGMYALYAVMVLAGLALALGWRPRWAALAFTLGFAYAEAIDVTTYLNHYELVTLIGVLCVVLPLPGRGSAARATVPAWAVCLLRFQLGAVYVFAGLGKVDVDWLLRGEPLHTWLLGRTDLPLVGPWFADRWVAVALSWGGALFDLGVVAFLLRRRTRPYAYAAVVVFHPITGWLFPGIGAFPFVMIVLTPIFFEPDWPDRVRAAVGRRFGLVSVPPVTPVVAVPATPSSAWRVRLGTAAVVVWVVVQLVVPLRHLAYPGDVRWTEEGYRWSWRVLLTEKEGSATFRVTDPATGLTRTVWPSDELAPHQVRSMSVRPDLIRQYAHHLADETERSGAARPEVRVDAWVAIAGLPRTRLMDPAVDLAAEPLDLWPADDIEPSPL